MTAVLELTSDLIRRASLTPEDAGCQALIAERLQRAGFQISHLPFGTVENLWATQGEGAPVLCFLGHTDVVPTGPVEHWHSPPFEPSVRDVRLYGRGAADMKGSVAAMVVALEEFVATHPHHAGTVALLLTSDEEGDAIHGVRAVARHFAETGQRIDACIVGEPSARERLGDTVRIGRRGSLTGTLTVRGVQGHVAYPHLADNPIHRALPVLTQLAARQWDEGSEGFPPTSFQIAHVAAGSGASNVIPGELRLLFNFRYCPRWSADGLMAEVEHALKGAGLDFSLDWHRSGDPFFTPDGPLRSAVREAVREITGLTPEENTAGGTSDGRFIAPLGAQVVEVGPLNASIHQIDEFVPIDELERLPALYRAIAERVLVRESD
ncbi:MAG: succinyl-diaminopimelate desuccinylase [Xanthomonadales bacterium]|nr:succinyl-diaminopimelate desuccinylase [Xanthomonadales bacterium]